MFSNDEWTQAELLKNKKLLEENGIKVFNENELKELAKFIKKNKSL